MFKSPAQNAWYRINRHQKPFCDMLLLVGTGLDCSHAFRYNSCLGEGVFDEHVVVIPAGSAHEQAIDVGALSEL